MTKAQKAKLQFKLDIRNIYSLEPDQWGNFTMTSVGGGKRRLKINKIVWRWEIKAGDRWSKSFGASYNAPTDSVERKRLHTAICNCI